jgi:hypothetical protein
MEKKAKVLREENRLLRVEIEDLTMKCEKFRVVLTGPGESWHEQEDEWLDDFVDRLCNYEESKPLAETKLDLLAWQKRIIVDDV